MTVLIFALLSASLLLSQRGARGLAIGLALLTMGLTAALFLYQIHSPRDGWRMPWIQVRALGSAGATAA